jgi:hypothetical protein
MVAEERTSARAAYGCTHSRATRSFPSTHRARVISDSFRHQLPESCESLCPSADRHGNRPLTERTREWRARDGPDDVRATTGETRSRVGRVSVLGVLQIAPVLSRQRD